MLGKEEARQPMDGRTDGQWTSGKLEGGPRSIFRLDLLPPPTRSPSHEPLIALFAPIFFFLPLLFSLFFFFRAGENRLSGNAKEETPFETMLFYRRTGSITLRPDIVYPWPAIDRIFGIVGLNEFFTRFMRRGDNGRLEFFCKLFNFPPWFYQYSF